MTEEQLDQLIREGRPQQVAPAVAGLDQRQRRGLAAPAYSWYQELHEGKGRAQELAGLYQNDRTRNPYQTAALCVLATAELKRASRVRFWWFPDTTEVMSQAVVKILEDRRPKWATRWLEKNLEGENFFPWALLEELVMTGVCEKPKTDDYIRALGDRFNDFRLALSPRLRERPHLLEEDIWRLFEVSTGAFAHDQSKWAGAADNYESWGTALVRLAGEGVISRERLLDSALEGLARDFTQNIYTGFIRMLKEAKPTGEELGARQEILRELLASPVSHVTRFALAGLKKAQGLQKQELLSSMLPVMSQKVKGNAVTALKWVAAMVEEDPALRTQARPIFEAGAHHSNVDVRELASDWLGATPTAEVVEELPEHLDLNGVESHWVKLLELDAATFPAPLEFEMAQVPMLDSLQRSQPIEDLQELIDTVTRAVEEVDSGLEVERILGGISRLCDRRPADFEARTEALYKRVESFQPTDVVRGLVSAWGGFSDLLKHLILVWLRGPRPHVQSTYYKPVSVYPFLKERVAELVTRVSGRSARVLLSEPTHERGWIEPSVLVERMKAGLEPERADLILALLRLAPVGREAALERLADSPLAAAAPLRWALGGGSGPGRREKELEIWLAAARARQPRGRLEIEGLPEEAVRPVEPQWTCTWVGKEYKFPRFSWTPEPLPPETGGAVGFLKKLVGGSRARRRLMPTVLLQQQGSRGWETPDLQGSFVVRWLALLWPGNLDFYWKAAANALVERLDYDTTAAFPNFAYLDPLFEPDRPWADLEYLVLSLALISKDADVLGLGIDALIEALNDGRAHHGPFATVLVRLYEADWIKPNRLAESLSEVARVGALHRRAVAEVLGKLLERPLPKGGHHLLQLMLEVSDGVSVEARSRLGEFSGGGKTARLVKRLLEMPEPAPLEQFRVLALRGRAERGRRWG